MVGAIVLDPLVVSLLPASWSSPPSWLFAYNLLGPALIVLLLIRFVDGQRLTAQQESRDLLQDMLPGRIAERLADGERLIAETHPDVSVLFADVVGFTEFADHVEADDLLLTLNQLFSAFDRIAARHGIEKIKTTGDAYIAVAGAPVAKEGHALARCARQPTCIGRSSAWVACAAAACSCGWASPPGRSRPASSASIGTPTTCGATR